jgi:hypothetical protein
MESCQLSVASEARSKRRGRDVVSAQRGLVRVPSNCSSLVPRSTLLSLEGSWVFESFDFLSLTLAYL